MKYVYSLCSKLGITILAGAAFSLAALTPVTAAPLAGACVPTATNYKVSTTVQTTVSTSPVFVLETFVKFTQGGFGGNQSCVIVSFSAEAAASPNTIMIVDALLDDIIGCQPTNNFFVQSNATATGFTDHAMSYVCQNVAPGIHSVRMEFRSNNGLAVQLLKRTTIVNHVK
jgi:hypothetical protein